MAASITKKRIAVLGGGVGAMTTAFELTESPDWQNKYEITVYQLGWRLGGKGASGRNQDMGDRIEEHGLHLWFGYYENAFNVIRRCYKALGRKPDQPLATWQDAFHKHSLFVISQYYDASWTGWHVSPPAIGNEVPGDGRIPPFWEIVDRLLAAMHGHFDEHAPSAIKTKMCGKHKHPSWLDKLIDKFGLFDHRDKEYPELHVARQIVKRHLAGETPAHELREELLLAVESIGKFLERLRDVAESHLATLIEEAMGVETVLRRIESLVELGWAMFKGIVVDDVANKGFDQLDHLDLREWLASHGAGPLALNSDALRVSYESIFAFENGSYAEPNLAAGTGLRGLLRLCFTYKGAFAWKMQAGMGDTIFAPFYQALKARGVKFEFFTRIDELVPSQDGTHIEQISLSRQATVISGEYNPLFDVKGLPCWPSTPLFDQLQDGEKLKAEKTNFESFWTPAQATPLAPLKVGVDFDEVVMGISLGSVQYLCPQLIDQKPEWKNMVDHVKSVRTQAFQIWTRQDTHTLRTPPGKKTKPFSQGPIYGAFAQPHNTLADMSHLIPRENWPEDDQPAGIFYACGPLVNSQMLPLIQNSPQYPVAQSEAAHVRAEQWIRTNGQFLFPGALSSGYPKGFTDTFDFEILYYPGLSQPPSADIFRTQFWRANIDPSERYVLSTKGSTQYRLNASDSGYSNLVLSGDWTNTAMNVGCVEAATMSGMEASRAICGYPKIIFGENFPKMD